MPSRRTCRDCKRPLAIGLHHLCMQCRILRDWISAGHAGAKYTERYPGERAVRVRAAARRIHGGHL